MNDITMTKYQIIIELKDEPNPMTPNHTEALFANPNNKNQIKVLEVVKLEDE